MLCPVCRTPLETVPAEGHYGTHLDAHVCRACGGYWFDGGKATALGFQGAAALDGAADLDAVVRDPHGAPRPCPRCEHAMGEMSGAPLPEGLHLDQCIPCRGLWFDMGELVLYKSAIERRRRSSSRPTRHPPLRLQRNRLPPPQHAPSPPPQPLGIVQSSARPGPSESVWEFMWDIAFAGIGGRMSGLAPPLPKFGGDPMVMTDRELGTAPRVSPPPESTQ